MTLKKDRLVSALANLAASHSASDWREAADSLQDIAKLARAIGELDISRPKKGRKLGAVRPQSKKPQARRPTSDIKQSERLLPSTDVSIADLSMAKLRDLAVEIGIKEELPKTRDAIGALIFQHLESMDKPALKKRISQLNEFLSQKPTNQEDNYRRWVDLITKKISSD